MSVSIFYISRFEVKICLLHNTDNAVKRASKRHIKRYTTPVIQFRRSGFVHKTRLPRETVNRACADKQTTDKSASKVVV